MSHILSKFVLQYKRQSYNHCKYHKNKYKNQGFSLIWNLDLGAWSATSGGVSFSLSLRDPCIGKVTEANCFLKFWEAAPGWGASVTLSEMGPF